MTKFLDTSNPRKNTTRRFSTLIHSPSFSNQTKVKQSQKQIPMLTFNSSVLSLAHYSSNTATDSRTPTHRKRRTSSETQLDLQTWILRQPRRSPTAGEKADRRGGKRREGRGRKSWWARNDEGFENSCHGRKRGFERTAEKCGRSKEFGEKEIDVSVSYAWILVMHKWMRDEPMDPLQWIFPTCLEILFYFQNIF